MKNGIFTLSLNDVSKALVMAVLTGAALPIAAAIQSPGFNILTANWQQIAILALNGALIGGVSYLVKNFLSDESGKFMGRIG